MMRSLPPRRGWQETMYQERGAAKKILKNRVFLFIGVNLADLVKNEKVPKQKRASLNLLEY